MDYIRAHLDCAKNRSTSVTQFGQGNYGRHNRRRFSKKLRRCKRAFNDSPLRTTDIWLQLLPSILCCQNRPLSHQAYSVCLIQTLLCFIEQGSLSVTVIFISKDDCIVLDTITIYTLILSKLATTYLGPQRAISIVQFRVMLNNLAY